jgi:hypothetical protein
MKRQEKQKVKAERREQRKLTKGSEPNVLDQELTVLTEPLDLDEVMGLPPESAPQQN